jgi:hypothetical protein
LPQLPHEVHDVKLFAKSVIALLVNEVVNVLGFSKPLKGLDAEAPSDILEKLRIAVLEAGSFVLDEIKYLLNHICGHLVFFICHGH